jgi:hypothetical protein
MYHYFSTKVSEPPVLQRHLVQLAASLSRICMLLEEANPQGTEKRIGQKYQM